ncbi:hypothetical protein ACFLZX_01875 [Nanoarchaeota archaeon]
MAEQRSSKVRKKLWYQVVSTKQFNEQPLGETIVYDPNDMIGKTMKTNLMTLTNDMKKQNTIISFKVDRVEGNKGKTSIVGYSLVPSSVKRLVRRNRDKIDLSFVCKTSDGVLVRIKPLIITKANAKGSVLNKMRQTCVQECTNHISKITYDRLVDQLLARKLLEGLFGQLKKLYPLKLCDIRVMKVLPTESRVKVEKATKVEAPKKVEEKPTGVPKVEAPKEEKKVEVKEEVKTETASA